MSNANPLADRTVASLLGQYSAILAELRRRGVVRTNNAPAGDYAEWLVAKALGGAIADNRSAKSYDITLPDGDRIQVKARLVSDPVTRGQLQTSAFRSWDFELACFVLLRGDDYTVHRAVLMSQLIAQSLASRMEHVNGWRILMTEAVLSHSDARDITDQMRMAALEG